MLVFAAKFLLAIVILKVSWNTLKSLIYMPIEWAQSPFSKNAEVEATETIPFDKHNEKTEIPEKEEFEDAKTQLEIRKVELELAKLKLEIEKEKTRRGKLVQHDIQHK